MEIGATATALALTQSLLKTPLGGTLGFERGQQFAMLVVERLDTQLFLLQVQPQGPMVRAQAPDILRPGQTVTLEVARSGDLPELKLLTSAPGPGSLSPQEQVITQATRQYLPRQQNLAHVQSRLLALMHRPDTLHVWPEPVREALRRLAQTLPTRSELTSPEGVARAIARSGIFADQSQQTSVDAYRAQALDTDTAAHLPDIKRSLQALSLALSGAPMDSTESDVNAPLVENAPQHSEAKPLNAEPAANRDTGDKASARTPLPRETPAPLLEAEHSAPSSTNRPAPFETPAPATPGAPATASGSAPRRGLETALEHRSDPVSPVELMATEPSDPTDSRRNVGESPPKAVALLLANDLPKRSPDAGPQIVPAPLAQSLRNPPTAGLELEDPPLIPLASDADDVAAPTNLEFDGQRSPKPESAGHTQLPFIARTALAGHTAYALASRDKLPEDFQLSAADSSAGPSNSLFTESPLAELHKLAEAGIAKIVMDQLASVPGDTHTVPVWHCELPFVDDNQVRDLSLAIHADRASCDEPGDAGAWQVSIEVTPPGLGLIAAKLSGKGKLIDAQFWCASPATAALLDDHLEVLRTRLQDAGLDPRHLAAGLGQRFSEPLPLPSLWAILDEHA